MSGLVQVRRSRDLFAWIDSIRSFPCMFYMRCTYANAGLLVLGAKAVAEANRDTARTIFIVRAGCSKEYKQLVGQRWLGVSVGNCIPWLARGRLARQSIVDYVRAKERPGKDVTRRHLVPDRQEDV